MHTDIRRFMPQTPQTDPDKFPDYIYQPYPRMMTHEAGGKKVPYKDAGGNPVIVQNATEEANFLARHNRGDEVKQEPKAEAIAIQQIVAAPVTERKKPGPKPKLAHVTTKLPEPLT
jgi:hypothetical protein